MAGSAAIAIAVVGAGASVYYQDKASDAQEDAAKERRAVSRAQAVRERQQQIRRSRIARAQAVNQAYTSGGIGSTLSGAQSSIGSQLGANLGFNEGTLRRSERAGGFDSKAVGYGTMANLSATAGSLGSSMAGGGLFQPSSGGVPGASRDVDNLVYTRPDLFGK